MNFSEKIRAKAKIKIRPHIIFLQDQTYIIVTINMCYRRRGRFVFCSKFLSLILAIIWLHLSYYCFCGTKKPVLRDISFLEAFRIG